ncbi:MAG TPA: ABC transporter permease [Dehalococcoidales bacterium]|nr:ABC transporter permease [Dehalococcoidales bacterium]
MTTYIIRRLLAGLLIIFLVTVITFFVIRLLPGDPIAVYIGQQAASGAVTERELEILREQYGLNDPIVVQFFNWLGGVLTGDLGESLFFKQSVGSLMADRFPVTLHLGLTSFVIANLLGVLMGVLAAIRRGTWLDTLVTTLANIGITIPVFWLGLLMMYVFGLQLKLLPIAGYVSPFEDFSKSTQLLVMPVFCMAVTSLAGIARQTRSSMLEVVRQDYIRTAWSKGLRERVVIFRHALKISLLPVITMMGMAVGMIFGGSVLIETVFAIPGIGRLLTQSIFNQDYQVIQSGVLIIAGIIVLVNLIVDISYGWFDPRIRYS